MAYENILTETRGRVGLVTLNRPKQLNALNDAMMNELGAALEAFDADDAIGAIVITGMREMPWMYTFRNPRLNSAVQSVAVLTLPRRSLVLADSSMMFSSRLVGLRPGLT